MKFNSVRTFLTIIAIAALACMAANAGTITYPVSPLTFSGPTDYTHTCQLQQWDPPVFPGHALQQGLHMGAQGREAAALKSLHGLQGQDVGGAFPDAEHLGVPQQHRQPGVLHVAGAAEALQQFTAPGHRLAGGGELDQGRDHPEQARVPFPLLRLPQEDSCQALSIPPALKYESEGGPGITAILRMLRDSDTPAEDQRAFLKTIVVFWLMGATDGHAKNFSVFLYPGGRYRMTPLYDFGARQELPICARLD